MVEKNSSQQSYQNYGTEQNPWLVPLEQYMGREYFTRDDLLHQGYVNLELHPRFKDNVVKQADETEMLRREAIDIERRELGFEEKYGKLNHDTVAEENAALDAVRRTAEQNRIDKLLGNRPVAPPRL